VLIALAALAGCYFDLGEQLREGEGQPSQGVLTVNGAEDDIFYETEVYSYPDAITDAAALNIVISNLAPSGTGTGLAGNGTLEIGLQKPNGAVWMLDGDFLVVLKDATDAIAPMKYKSAVKFTGGSATLKYSTMETATDAPSGTDGDGQKREVWRWSKKTVWKVTDGIAASVYYEQVPEYTSYVDEWYYECKYSYKLSGSTYLNEVETSRNGLESQIRQVTKTDDPGYEHKSITDYVYDADSRLMQQQIVNITETQNGITTPSRTEHIYTITLQSSDANGEKTYKKYYTSTGANGDYELYTIKDGVTLSMSSYDADGALYYTRTTEFPSAPVIRERLPTLTLYKYTYASTPSRNDYETCELLASTDTSLTVRIKTFYTSTNVLSTQSDYTYTKITLP
jgi:hypothetical protein